MMRAVYVPTPVVAGTSARLVAKAPAIEDGGTLTFYQTSMSAPRTVLLTPERLRELLRQWAAADRDGQGILQVSD